MEAVWTVGSMQGVELTPELKGGLKEAVEWKKLRLLNTEECGKARMTSFAVNLERHAMSSPQRDLRFEGGGGG